MPGQFIAVAAGQQTEPAGVIINDNAVVGFDNDMVMFNRFGQPVGNFDFSAHAQMQDNAFAVVQINDNIFGAPPIPLNTGADNLPDKIIGDFYP